jgi:peptidyl-prolyl cis-trans isomerase D
MNNSAPQNRSNWKMIRFLQTKGRVQQFLLVGFLSIIIIMMVVTLVPGGGGVGDFFGLGMSQNVLAKVGGDEITVQDVNKQAQRMARQQFRGQVPPSILPFFIQRANDMLITQRIILNEAHRMGLNATEADLRDALQHGPLAEMIFPGGNFIGQQQYQNLIQGQANMTVQQFETEMRDQLTIDKLRTAIEGGVVVTQSELMDEFKQQNTKIKFDYAVLSLEDVAKTVNPTDAELHAFYERMKPQLTNSIPEQRKARYILVDYAHAGVRISQADLESYYKQHMDEFRVPESVTVRHILVKTPTPDANGKVDQKELDAAKAKAEDILKQLKAGGSFDALAKKYSDDPGSKERGGLLGPIRRGQTVPEFEQAAFAAKKGDTVGPVKSNFGYHIIHIDDKTEPHVKPLDEVKSQFEPLLLQQKGQAATEQMAKSLQSTAATQGLDKAAASKDLQVMETGLFARGANLPGVGSAPGFQDAVFNQKPNATPQAVAIPNGWAVVQATDVKPPATPTFEEAKAQLAAQFKQEKAQSELVRKATELADKAKSAHNLRAAAKAVGATVKTSEFVKPGDQVPDIGQLAGQTEAVFSLKPGEIAGPVAAGNNNAIVFSLLQRQEPPASEFEQQKDQIRLSVLQRKRQEIIEAYITSLRDKMQKEGKIRVNDKELQKLTASVGQE